MSPQNDGPHHATRLSGGQIDLARSALSRLEQARARLSVVLEKTA
jgi:hypothetical protein